MNGRTQTTTQVQDNSPWGPQQPYTLDVFRQAQQAFNQTNRGEFQGDLFAGPTAAQQAANSQMVDLSQLLAGMPNPVASGLQALQGQTAGATAAYNPQQIDIAPQLEQAGFNVSPAPTLATMTGTRSGAADVRAGRQGFRQVENPEMEIFNFVRQALAPTGQYGGVDGVDQAIQQVAGESPVDVGPSGLQEAIRAAVAPLQREWEEQLNPLMEHQAALQGVTGNSRTGFETARAFENSVSRPGSEIAARLAFEDYARRSQQAQENYQLLARLGAGAAENQSNRLFQDLTQLRGQSLQQALAENQFNFQDVSERRSLDAEEAARLSAENLQFSSLMNQLNQQDVMQRRALMEQEAARLDQLNLQQVLAGNQIQNQNYRDIMSLLQRDQAGRQDRAAGDLQQIRALQAQLGLAGNQNLLQDVMQQRSLAQGAAQGLPALYQGFVGSSLLPSQIMGQAGQQQQQWNQGFLDEALQLYNMQNAAPWAGLLEYANIINGTPFMSTTSTTTAPRSGGGLGGAVQGGLGGAGVGFSIGGPMGAVIGGGLGALGGLFG